VNSALRLPRIIMSMRFIIIAMARKGVVFSNKEGNKNELLTKNTG